MTYFNFEDNIFMNKEKGTMTREQMLKADKWLVENQDKWDNGEDGFVFLVPENEVPEEVKERVKGMKEAENMINSSHKIVNEMK